MRWCFFIGVLVADFLSAALGSEQLTVLQLLTDLKRQQHFDNLLLLKNANASISSNYTAGQDESGLVRDIMEQLLTPVLLLTERTSYFLKEHISSHLLTVVYVAGSQLEQHSGLLKALVANLRLMTVSRVVILLQPEQADEMLLYKLFQFCWQQRLLNVLALFGDHQITNTFYSYTHFPVYRLEQRLYDPGEDIFTERLQDLQGFKLPIIVGGSAPRIIAYRNKQGRLVYEGLTGHFVQAFEQKYNCNMVQPLPTDPLNFPASSETVAAVRNGSVEISLGSTYPTIPMRGYTYPFEQLNWCIMLPVEADIPAAELYTKVFELSAFLLTIAVMVAMSMTLAATLWRFGYRVHLYEFLMHDSCLRGALGQSFVEVFQAPPLVRGIYLQICILGILLTAWYNSYFSSYVTSAPKEPPFRSIDAVLHSNLKVVAWKPEFEELIGRQAQMQKYAAMFLVEPSFARYISMRDSFNTKYGYMMTTTKWVVINEQQKVFTSPLFQMPDYFCMFNNVPIGFPVHENSIYMEPIHSLIMDLSAHGLTAHWVTSSFMELIEAGQLHFVDLSPRREFRAMQVNDLMLVGYGYAFLVLLSTSVLLLELAWHWRRKGHKRLGRSNPPQSAPPLSEPAIPQAQGL